MTNFVPKVHPATRALAADDPLELVAQPMAGDAGVMLECVIQEFIWLGWNTEQLVQLFSSPAFPVLNQLLEYFGPEEVRRRVEALLDRSGVLKFREKIVDEPEIDDEPDLYQIDLAVELGTPNRNAQPGQLGG
jgi:hypothetical protein